MQGIVDVSIDHAYRGLYLTPDMRFYASTVLGNALLPIVDKVIHGQQPLTHHYADFADIIYDEYAAVYGGTDAVNVVQILMTLFSLSTSRHCLARGVWSMTEVAASLYYRSKGITEQADLPLLIPPSLHDVRIERPWQIDQMVFHRIVRVEPWLSWTERLRAEARRNRRVLAEPKTELLLAAFWTTIDAKDTENATKYDPKAAWLKDRAARRLQQAARRSIKRAVKLHDRFQGGVALRQFIAGQPVMIGGIEYDYRLEKIMSVMRGTIRRDTGMAPVSLVIIDKHGVNLATGCLVFKDVSVLDYLFHVRMMASNAESEQRMLRAMHITSVTNQFFDDPLHIIKGILDRYTAPLHTLNNLLTFPASSPRFEERLGFFDVWQDMALRTLLEVADLDERFYYDVLTVCEGHNPFRPDNTIFPLQTAVNWLKRRRTGLTETRSPLSLIGSETQSAAMSA